MAGTWTCGNLTSVLTEEQKAYAAGLFDGEGSIQIAKGSRKDRPTSIYYRSRVDLAMTHKPTVEWLHSVFGGHFAVRLRGPYTNSNNVKYKPIWRWAIESASAADFLRTIRPYLITKAEQADIALELCGRCEQVRADRWSPLTDDELAERERLYLQIKSLNKRG